MCAAVGHQQNGRFARCGPWSKHVRFEFRKIELLDTARTCDHALSLFSMPRRKPPAKTLDDLGGAASNVSFIRTDASAISKSKTSSQTKINKRRKGSGPRWPLLNGEEAATILRGLSQLTSASDASGSSSGSARPAGLCLGRAAVSRALRRRELRALVIAQDSGPPVLHAHLAALAQAAGTPSCLLACGSAQLGQPFGLLRASAVGLRASHFGEEHDLVALLTAAAQRLQPKGPLPWLDAARGSSEK